MTDDDSGDVLRLSAFQERVMRVPEECDLALLGGRGGGKSYALMLLVLRHVDQHGARAHVLYLRATHRANLDFATTCLELFGKVYGKGLRFNAAESLFRFPNGASLELNQIESESDLTKFLGRSATMLLVDEAGEFPSPILLDRLRGNLRAPNGINVRTVLCANPGGCGHAWLSRRYAMRTPWQPFTEETSGRLFVLAPSTYEDNSAINREQYRRQLEAATATDPELRKAWITGTWSIARGAFFAEVLDEQRCATDVWRSIPVYRGEPWESWISYDHGASAPAICHVLVRSPGAAVDGRFFARDSIVCIDELAVCDPNDISKGLQWPVQKIAESIVEMCDRWGIDPSGGADPAIFANLGYQSGTIANEFARCGVYFHPSSNNRLAGWTRMRRMFADCGAPDRAGLYVARACEHFWQSAPTIGRDPRRIEDVDSRHNDHSLDSLRYGVMYEPFVVTQTDMYGTNGLRLRV